MLRYPACYEQNKHLEKKYFQFSETPIQLFSVFNSEKSDFISCKNFKDIIVLKSSDKARV